MRFILWMWVVASLLLGGCSAASVTETYERTPAHAGSQGTGRSESYKLIFEHGQDQSRVVALPKDEKRQAE